jgi:hypothetical protein
MLHKSLLWYGWSWLFPLTCNETEDGNLSRLPLMILFATSSVIHLKNNGTPVTWKHNASQRETDVRLIGCAMHEAVISWPVRATQQCQWNYAHLHT